MGNRLSVLVAVVIGAGCGPSVSAPDGSGAADAGGADAGGFDAGALDAGVIDAGVFDAGPLDGGARDAGAFDAGMADAGRADAGSLLVQRLLRRVDAGSSEVDVQLLTLHFPGREPTYAQWMPVVAADGGRAPVLLVAKPYDGIAWPADARDQRWAALGAGIHPDLDGPDAGPTPTSLLYTPLTIEAQADEAGLYRLHGISVLAVYGRFYAGGSIQNDVDDMVNGLEFLAQEPGVDLARIGIEGGSWGGFLALYGAAYAPAAATPRIGSALYPLSDFAEEWRFITTTMPSRLTTDAGVANFARFFDAYLRRISASTGGGPDGGGAFTRFDVGALAARLRTPFFVVHEDWDALVGVDQSTRLAAARPDLIRPIWLRHAASTAPWDAIGTSHGPLMQDFGGVASFTFVWSTLLRELADTSFIFVPWTQQPDGGVPLTRMLEHARDASRAGARHDELARELRGLLDPRVTMYGLPLGQVESGGAFVSRQVNQVWGLNTSVATIGAVLDGGLPP